MQPTFNRSHRHNLFHECEIGLGGCGRRSRPRGCGLRAAVVRLATHSHPQSPNHFDHDPFDLFLGKRHASAIPITDQRIGVFSCLTHSRTNLPSLVIITVCPLPAPTASTAICGSPSGASPSAISGCTTKSFCPRSV